MFDTEKPQYKYTVHIIRYSDHQPIKKIPVKSSFTAERVDNGLNHNLNHKEYYTEIYPYEEGDENFKAEEGSSL